MSTDISDFSLSTLSLHSTGSQNEDWDSSLIISDPPSPSTSTSVLPDDAHASIATTTPRNSVIFPADDNNATPGRSTGSSASSSIRGHGAGAKGKRSLSELLRLHAEKGTDCKFSPEEALRVADVLGQWINAASSPYEGEDDFFARSHDDLSLPPKRSPNHEPNSRPRGQSESAANSRPPSSAGSVKT